MNSVKMNIWGREFDLDIVFDSLRDGTIYENQYRTLDLFLDANKSRLNVENKEEKNIEISHTEIKQLIEDTKTLVEKYCLDNTNEDIDNPITNIFKYVIPKYLYVSRTNDDSRRISLMCNFKFDMEHGLAIIFKNEKLEKIGEQALVL